jgi:hypothetical protein
MCKASIFEMINVSGRRIPKSRTDRTNYTAAKTPRCRHVCSKEYQCVTTECAAERASAKGARHGDPLEKQSDICTKPDSKTSKMSNRGKDDPPHHQARAATAPDTRQPRIVPSVCAVSSQGIQQALRTPADLEKPPTQQKTCPSSHEQKLPLENDPRP